MSRTPEMPPIRSWPGTPLSPISRAKRLRLGLRAPAVWVIALAIASASCSSSTTSTTASTTKAAFSCDDVPASQVQSSLGVQVNGPVSTVNGPVTVCTYHYTLGAGQVIIRVQTGVSRAEFDAARAQFGAHHEPTSTVSKLGDAAFSSTFGFGQLQSNTVAVLKGTTQLLVAVGPGVPLLEVGGFAKQLLPLV